MPVEHTPSPATLTSPALRALVASIIDYAGLFPPARLPLDTAIRNYARYRTEPDAWMLARFIIPVGRLGDLAPYAELFAENPPFRFSVLGPSGPDAEAFLQAFEADLETIQAFHRRHPGQVQVEAMEVRLPTALLGADADVARAFLDAVGRLRTASAPGLELFFEAPLDETLRDTAPAILTAMAAYNHEHGPRVGFKMRTGGTEPDAFPAAGLLAYALTACLRAGVPFKATAGLHHPVRRYHASVGAHMYGFFNFFGAAVLAAEHNLDEATVRAILLDEDPAHFRFTPDAFAWTTYTASPETIRLVRHAFARSYGSCSFDEPREDLKGLGLL